MASPWITTLAPLLLFDFRGNQIPYMCVNREFHHDVKIFDRAKGGFIWCYPIQLPAEFEVILGKTDTYGFKEVFHNEVNKSSL